MIGACTNQKGDMVGWSEFLPDVLPFARGVPNELAAHRVHVGAMEFCRLTGILKRVYYGDVYKTVENYAIADYDGYNFNMLHSVRVCGIVQKVLNRYPSGGYGSGAYFEPPNMLYILPPPDRDEPDGLEVELSVVPSQESCEIERFIYERYGQAIASHALSSLLRMKGTNWYDPSNAAIYYRQFKTAVNREKVRIEKGHQRGPLIMRATKRWY